MRLEVPETIDVVVRCRDEMPRAARCLDALAEQVDPRARVLFVDNGSTDGSREAAVARDARVHDVRAGSYVPGAVLNEAMRLTTSPIVAFVNADAVALHDDALARLVEPLVRDAALGASYARQVPTPEASDLTQFDYGRTFGDAELDTRVGRFFSMAVSAIRRATWKALPFDEELVYSEDVDWITRAGALGWGVAYVPGARFEKSREYDLRGHFRRRRGEGAADTLIHHLGRPSTWRELLRPLAGSLVRDLCAGVASPTEVSVRVVQAAGYFAGRTLGWPS